MNKMTSIDQLFKVYLSLKCHDVYRWGFVTNNNVFSILGENENRINRSISSLAVKKRNQKLRKTNLEEMTSQNWMEKKWTFFKDIPLKEEVA